MKIYSMALISLLVLASCQKAPDRAAQNPAAKPQDKPSAPATVGTITKIMTECSSKEVTKETDKDGKVSRSTSELTFKSVNVSELVEQKDDSNNYNISGEYTSESVDTNAKGEKLPAYKVDYTYTGTKTSKTQQIDSKNTKLSIARKITKTGRNGYQFYVGKDKPKSATSSNESQTEMSIFDDGAVTYVTDYTSTSNGHTMTFEQSGLGNYISNYTTEGAITKMVTTLKQPVVTKLPDGSIHELESAEENCTETLEKSAR